MKEINENRFQKKAPEPIAFQGVQLPDIPPPPPTHEPDIVERPFVRPDESEPSARLESVPSYVVRVPAERRKIRHPFDIFEDQLDALQKIQLAEREETRRKRRKALGEMAQEALDRYIAEKVKKLASIKLMRED